MVEEVDTRAQVAAIVKLDNVGLHDYSKGARMLFIIPQMLN